MTEIADAEIRRLCQEALEKAHALLRRHDREHHRLAKALLEHETLNADEMLKVVRGESIDTTAA
jgi:ATP-dependent Zn protease